MGGGGEGWGGSGAQGAREEAISIIGCERKRLKVYLVCAVLHDWSRFLPDAA